MSTAYAVKLNQRVSYIPRDFFGKNSKDKAGAFTTPLGTRFTASKILSLGLIHTESVMYGSLNRMPYSAFMQELSFARGTTARNLRELVEDGFLKRPHQSKYEILPVFSAANAVPVYHFLLNEKMNLGGKIKRLSYNAVLYLCEIINFELTPKEKRKNKNQKYFVGGCSNAAKATNTPPGTACGIIQELIDTKAMFRLQAVYDAKGNQIVSEGKGNSAVTKTVYKVNGKILRRCRAVQKYLQDVKELKKMQKLGGNAGDETDPQENDAKPAGDVVNENHRKYMLEIANEQKYLKLELRFAGNATYARLKQRYFALRADWFEALKKNEEERADQLAAAMNETLDGFRRYLHSHGAPPGDVPEPIQQYMKK